MSNALPNPDAKILILADEHGVGSALAEALQARGADATIVYAHDGESRLNQALEDAGSTYSSILHFWSLDQTQPNPTLAEIDQAGRAGWASVLHIVKCLAQAEGNQPRLWLFTRGAQAVLPHDDIHPQAAPVWGLGATIAHEYPELACTLVDLDSSDPAGSTDGLVDDILGRVTAGPVFEDRLALRAGVRYAARMEPTTAFESGRSPLDESRSTRQPVKPGQGFRLHSAAPGLLDHLDLFATQRAQPGPGEVEIQVVAAGLNFIDVMKALGIYPGMDSSQTVHLGGECAGRISAVGAGVGHLTPGDEVIAITSSFDTQGMFSAYVTLPAVLVARKPAGMSFEQAAGAPIAYLTALYAIQTQAHLQAGESILIHSATGGVGLAAVQLARQAGAEIFATAGSAEKRALLAEMGITHVADSRSLDFAAEILNQTGQAGVDVVLNSLAGEALLASLQVLKPYGRFCEIGKRDIYGNTRIGLEPFKKNLSFFAIDIARLISDRMELASKLFQSLVDSFETGALQPLPVTVFPISQAADGFRMMAQARHTGKIVFSFEDPQVSLAAGPVRPGQVSAQGTYLITGGSGGLGLATASWLVERGARSLALVGRRLPGENARTHIAALEAQGALVRAFQADVSVEEDVRRVIDAIEADMLPLRGIIHAAGLLEDRLIAQQTEQSFSEAMAPKINGAWNLHTLTRDLPLDFFVLYSSVVSVLGSPGQSNYTAANAFLDALAHHRRAQGLPAMSIQWGPWSEIGLAAEQANRGERLSAMGMRSLTPDEGMEALAAVMEQQPSQVLVLHFDPAQWSEHHPSAAKSGLLSQLQTSSAAAAPNSSSLRGRLLAEKPGTPRQVLLESHLREQVGQVIRMDPGRIDTHKPLRTLGIDSLMTLELRNRLENSTELSLPATLVWNYPTIAAMAAYLAEKMELPFEDHPQAELAAQTQPQPPVEAQPLEDLDQADVEALLDQELSEIDDLLKGILDD